MQIMIDILTGVLPLLYTVVSIVYVIYFTRYQEFVRYLCTSFLLITFFIHIFYIIFRSIYFTHYPITNLSETLTMSAMAVVGTYLCVERLENNKYTGAFILPMVVIIQYISSFTMPHVNTLNSLFFKNIFFGLHTIFAVIGYSAFMLGAMYSIMYILLYRVLKNQKFGLLFNRLPSLDKLTKMSFRATLLGWVCLGITLFLGIIMSIELIPYFYKNSKFITTIIVFTMYGCAVLSYFIMGFRSQRMIYFSLIGFLFTIFTQLWIH